MRYEKLEAWKAAYALTIEVYRVTSEWPPRERYGMTAQVRRAAASVVANIAEGSAKEGPGEFRRYLDISWGSFAELCSLLHLATGLGFLDPARKTLLEPFRDRVGRLLWGLRKTMARSAKYS